MAAPTTRGRSTAAKAAPTPEPEIDEIEEFDELELDDTDEDTATDEVENGDEAETVEDDGLTDLDDTEDEPVAEPETTAKPKAKAKPKAEPKPKPEGSEFNSAWLGSHVTEVTGQAYDGRAVRMLLRKLATTEGSAVNRKVGEDRDRYIFPGGASNPIVAEVVALVQSGEAQKIKRAGLDKVKADADAKKAAKKAAAAAAAAETEAEDAEDGVVETPAPKPAAKPRAKATTAKATPAKATPSTRQRATAK